jgi:sigma-B regulation protein RsbU (phosphoserine phosphatase)
MKLKNLFSRLKAHKSWRTLSAFSIIILAGALIEAISLLQYNYTHRLMEKELDYHAESEMTLKSVRVKGILKSNEELVRNYVWPIQHQCENPEKLYSILRRIVENNSDVMSCFVAFAPNYYPDHGLLFEPCAIRQADSITTKQLGSKTHNYTTREFYHEVMENKTSSWTDPYLDQEAGGEIVTTYATAITDKTGQTVAAFGIDLSTQGIIDTLNTKHNLPSTFFLLLNADGKLISRPDSNHTQQSDVAKIVEMINDSTYERKSSSTGISKVITFNDKENGKGYAYYAFMQGKPHWQVVMVCYDNEVYGKLKNMQRNLLLLMLAAFSLLGYILYRFNCNVSRLHQINLNKERAESELRIAQNIQSEMLPSQTIHRPEVDICGKQVTALEVGGDLYDYLVRNEKLYFCIGDVSGKGVPSSLVMAVVHSYFRNLTQHESNPASIMKVINESATESNETNMFVTLLIGVLDLPTGRLRYCNAGHDAPLIISQDVRKLAVDANLPVGVFDDFKYVVQEEQLPPDCTLLLYTDGLTEAADNERHLFGLKRVIDTAKTCLEQGKTEPATLLETMYQSATQFAGDAKQSDDLTMLAIHYHQPVEDIVLDERLALTNDIHQVPELNDFVKSVAGKLNLEPSLMSQLMLAVEEAVVNVMNYAYPIGTQGDVTIEARATAQSLRFVIIDEGKAFDPTQDRMVDTTLSAEDRPIGGLGILLVQKLMDSINYERVNGKNYLTLKKEITKPTK